MRAGNRIYPMDGNAGTPFTHSCSSGRKIYWNLGSVVGRPGGPGASRPVGPRCQFFLIRFADNSAADQAFNAVWYALLEQRLNRLPGWWHYL